MNKNLRIPREAAASKHAALFGVEGQNSLRPWGVAQEDMYKISIGKSAPIPKEWSGVLAFAEFFALAAAS